jgi:hypothetical protein
MTRGIIGFSHGGTMKRAIALAVLISFVAVPIAHAEERKFTPKTSITFSPTATPAATPAPARTFVPVPAMPRLTSKASIEKAVATATRGAAAPVMRRKSIFKKAWFWALVGGAAAVIIIWAAGGDDGGDGGPY